MCQPDLECNCPMCWEYSSIDDDHANYPQSNQHSLHLGIVSFWPLFYGLVDDDEVLSNMLTLLEDESRMMSPYGVRSLSAKD